MKLLQLLFTVFFVQFSVAAAKEKELIPHDIEPTQAGKAVTANADASDFLDAPPKGDSKDASHRSLAHVAAGGNDAGHATDEHMDLSKLRDWDEQYLSDMAAAGDETEEERRLGCCACSINKPSCCITDAACNLQGAAHSAGSVALGEFRVSVKNKCHATIWVAIRYKLTSIDYWITDGWWELYPGETAYIADTKNRHVYFTAQSDDGHSWGSSDYVYSVNHKTEEKFFHTNMGSSFAAFTQEFSCN